MKNLFLLLILSSIVCYGQDKINVIDTADFYGFDMYGNYVETIEKIEVIENQDYLSKDILWKNSKSVLDRGFLSWENYLERPRTYFPYIDTEKLGTELFFNDENFCGFARNYKYFTNYSFSQYDNKDEIEVNYGTRLLKTNERISDWSSINNLFYKKVVKISKNKTVVENRYDIAINYENRYQKFTPSQSDFNNYYYTKSRNENYDQSIGISKDNMYWKIESSEIQKKLGKVVKDQLKRYVWINVDDKITLGNPCLGLTNAIIPQSVYDKNHIITLNDDFDYTQKIENGGFWVSGEDHSFTFTLGLENPSQDIDDFIVENAIEFRIRYISENTNLKYAKMYPNYRSGDVYTHYVKYLEGGYQLEIKKKINGVFYYEKKIFSQDEWGMSSDNYVDKKIWLYDSRREGLIKLFRKSNKIFFSLNNNLLDVTDGHNFDNNTIKIHSVFENLNKYNFRPFVDFSDRKSPDFKITKTVNKRLPLNEEFVIKKPSEWAGNGSGIIISKSGYIVTNNHVIEDADDIEVEFILNDEVQKFKAEIVQVDKVNDLAIIKIVDVNFDRVGELPYNFKTRSSDVGTKIYAYGYPMALSLMGKEIKITDGIISSKSGINGDITTYQISATIQPGNSGGPLFDDKGNFIGINSSGLARLGSESTGYTIKSSYVLNLIDVLPKSIDLPSSTKLQSLPLTEQIKEISKYVVLVKVK